MFLGFGKLAFSRSLNFPITDVLELPMTTCLRGYVLSFLFTTTLKLFT